VIRALLLALGLGFAPAFLHADEPAVAAAEKPAATEANGEVAAAPVAPAPGHGEEKPSVKPDDSLHREAGGC